MKTYLMLILLWLPMSSFAQNVKGFNLTEDGSLEFTANGPGEEKTAAQIAVDQAKYLGANHLVLNVRAKMVGPKSVDITPLTHTGSVSVETRKMVSLIKYIKDQGMTVGLRPIVFVVGPNGEFPYTETLADGSQKSWWHGNIQPHDPNRWFDNFQLYLDRYLTIARIAKVDEFTIGAELYSMTVGIEDQWLEHPHGFPGRWNQLLNYARTKLGPNVRIMYDINFTDDTETSLNIARSGGELERWRYRLVDLADTGTEEDKKIWQELMDFWNNLDAIGVDMYRSLAFPSDQIPEDYDALVHMLAQRATAYANQLDVTLLEISIYSNDLKPVILKEVGFRSVENAFIDPFTYATAMGNINVVHQAAGYEALFQGFLLPGFEWFDGFAFWDIPLSPHAHGLQDRGFSPVGKPETEAVIQKYFLAQP